MRTRLVALALGLLAVPGMVGADAEGIHYTPPAFLYNGSGFLAPGVILLPDGSATAPSLARAAQPSTGIFFYNNLIEFAVNGNEWARLTSAFKMRSDMTVEWGSTTNLANASDLLLSRDAAANLQLGSDAATATGQTISAADSTGAAVAGASLTLAGGAGGAGGAAGAVILSGPHFDGTSSVAFVDNTATAFVRVAVADDDVEGCVIAYTAYAEDANGDARQVRTGTVSVVIANNSGTEAAVFSTGDSAVSVTAGTLTCSFDGNSAVADTIDLRATCNTSLDAAAESLTFFYQMWCPSTVTAIAQ